MELIIAANWKMHKTVAETVDFCRAILQNEALFKDVEVLICPPFTALPASSDLLRGSSIKLGAQNMHWEREGAFTGEISAPLLLDLGVEYVIIGHSERRQLFGEDDSRVQIKMKAALENGLKPILCVGETEAEREEDATEKVIKNQLFVALEGLSAEQADSLVVAYEPVWAIGTGKAALPRDAETASSYINEVIRNKFGKEAVNKIRIQYGGSVKEDNIGSFAVLSAIQGALVGGASLEADTFSALIQAARKAVLS